MLMKKPTNLAQIPWALGPFELIQHAEGHFQQNGDFDRRIALIGFDNAIEVSIETFLTLPPAIRRDFLLTNIGSTFTQRLSFWRDFLRMLNLISR